MKVFVTGKIPEQVLSTIRQEHEVTSNTKFHPMDRQEILAGVKGKEGLLCMITDTIDPSVMDQSPALKVIANFGVGYNNIDVEAASTRGILVTNTPGVLTDATADIAFGLILAIGRRLVEGDKFTRAGKFEFWSPLHFLGSHVTGKTLGIFGMGRIGAAVARRAAGFDMKIIYHSRRPLDAESERTLGLTYVDADTLYRRSDFISLHVPLSPETTHMVGAEEFQKMKSTCFLINTSRGPVVDEAALVAALKGLDIAGAGLDVYENEPRLAPGLAGLNNVILLPHMGSATIETRTLMARMAADNLMAGLNGDKPPNCLNWEACCANR
ncbi:MAG: D-glycerate dehydrogenase [Desulfobacteraceae bacterium]|nr:D-glycerate dehydrogenase [Desulfobacteraceae bacterium]